MMMHAIGKQILDFKLDSSVDSFQLQHELSQWYWRKLVPEMEVLFDQYAIDQEVIQIERLEINLGWLRPGQILNGDFIEYVKQEMEAQLEKLIRQSLSNTVSIKPLEESEFEQWLFFLSHGRLPWMSLKRDEKWSIKVLEVLATQSKAVEATRQLLSTQPMALQRLVLQHTPEFLQAIAALFTRINQEELHSGIVELQQFTRKHASILSSHLTVPVNARSLEVFYWKEALEIIIVLGKKRSPLQLVRRILGSYFSPILLLAEQRRSGEPAFPIIREALQPNSTTEEESLWLEMLLQLEKLSPKERQAFLRQKEWRKIQLPPTQGSDSAIPPSSTPALPPHLKQEKESQTSKWLQKREQLDLPLDFTYEYDRKDIYLQERSQLQKQDLYINNAGLVLLHPFLKTYFDKLNLINGGDFKDESARHHAIHLLHFLGSGQSTQIPEYELILPKVLCGLPLGIPIDHQITISTSELEEGEALLQAAIDHWAALKTAKPAGLREGFLLREGKLSYNDRGWQLQVERKTLDILLDQLPWGVGIIKMPWMMDMLFVEWT